MREIKFRGKRVDNGEWVYGYYFIEERDIEDGIIWRDIPQIQQRYGDHFQYFDVDLATVGQYTGLKDKNGREIFEGDIVKVGDDYEVYGLMASEVREVYFGYGGFRLKSKNPEYKGCWLEDGKDVEVIGNIYENHELLKEDKMEEWILKE